MSPGQLQWFFTSLKRRHRLVLIRGGRGEENIWPETPSPWRSSWRLGHSSAALAVSACQCWWVLSHYLGFCHVSSWLESLMVLTSIVCMYSHVWLLWPHGLEPARFLCPWNFPGKNTRVGCSFLLQGIFPIQGSNPHLSHLLPWQVTFFTTESPGRPRSIMCCQIRLKESYRAELR